VVVLASLAVAATLVPINSDPNDPMLDGDPLDPATNRVAEIVPGAPWIQPGPDGEMGSDDDVVRTDVIGDIDLVLRSGITHFTGPIPDPTARTGPMPLGVAEPFGSATAVDFVVTASDGATDTPYGNPVAAPSLEGVGIFAVAFGDLDGDGFVGITHLDGDPLDAAIEEAELDPVGSRLVPAQAGLASGALRIGAGGPTGAELRVALAAGAYAGPLDPAFFGGAVADGPAVMTELPFLPRLAPDKLIDGDLPEPIHPDRPAAVEVEGDFEPDPGDPAIGEAFTLHTDGSDPSIDLARVHSGQFSRFGLAQTPDPLQYWAISVRPLRLGLDAAGRPAPYEILQRLMVADDGSASQVTLRLVPLDRLGNVSDLVAAGSVTIRSGGTVRIARPDFDGNPFSETLQVPDARGVEVVLDDAGGEFDDADRDALVLEGGGAISRLEIFLPDPDLDDNGVVDKRDVKRVRKAHPKRADRAGFDGRLDMTGDGRIGGVDIQFVKRRVGQAIPVP
jgi:hypothetical protein